MAITSDNLPLSIPSFSSARGRFAVDGNPHDVVDAKVAEFLAAAHAPNTRRAYAQDIKHFLAWGGQVPATEEMVANYLGDHAGRLAASTLARRLVGIRHAHLNGAHLDPTDSQLVRLTFKGIRRKCGRPQRRVAALLIHDLLAIIASFGNSTRDVRDTALLLVGFAGAFRRSELVGIDFEDLDISATGMKIRIPRSKTDQECFGRNISVPRTKVSGCPVVALERWLALSRIGQGPIFVPITRAGRVLGKRISTDAVARIVKRCAALIGRDSSIYSGHSLRSGFATSAAAAGISERRIRSQTGHFSVVGLQPYIREAEESNHPVLTLLGASRMSR